MCDSHWLIFEEKLPLHIRTRYRQPTPKPACPRPRALPCLPCLPWLPCLPYLPCLPCLPCLPRWAWRRPWLITIEKLAGRRRIRRRTILQRQQTRQQRPYSHTLTLSHPHTFKSSHSRTLSPPQTLTSVPTPGPLHGTAGTASIDSA